MRAQEVLDVVLDWYAVAEVASLQLPSGWFGRPFDSRHRLTASFVAADRLVLVLDDRVLLCLAHPTTVQAVPESLRISGFPYGTLDHDDYGSGGGSHVQAFREGEVVLVRP